MDSLSNFDPGVVLRGAQLTLVGAYRALQNPRLFGSEHYRQAALAVVAGLLIRLLLELPIFLVKVSLHILALFQDMEAITWDDELLKWLIFFEKQVLQMPFFLMSLIRRMSPAMDQLFMDSLKWVDETYMKKHADDPASTLRVEYYPNMVLWGQYNKTAKREKEPKQHVMDFITRFLKKGAISVAIYGASFLPVVGRFVLPAASFYSLQKAAGVGPAAVVSFVGLFVRRRYIIALLQSYFASRSLTRELLEPYFSRVRFTRQQKNAWFRDREGLLFGFGIGFYLLIKTPLIGVLIYGIAEASSAYLITKITDPPPLPEQNERFPETQTKWSNKAKFMKLDLAELETLHFTHHIDKLGLKAQ